MHFHFMWLLKCLYPILSLVGTAVAEGTSQRREESRFTDWFFNTFYSELITDLQIVLRGLVFCVMMSQVKWWYICAVETREFELPVCFFTYLSNDLSAHIYIVLSYFGLDNHHHFDVCWKPFCIFMFQNMTPVSLVGKQKKLNL
jgi:imidazoleglycerol phosphate dehydratase HisB